MSIYDTGALYAQNMSPAAQESFAHFYQSAFGSFNIKTIHDCSIGAGGTTLPLAKLGYTISGSDLSENLLAQAKVNFREHGFTPELFIADFTRIGDALPHKVDCIISTGNSLPHVDLNGFRQFIKSAASKLNDGGVIYFDIRNWDALAADKPIIHAINPKVMTAEEHRSIYQLLNWHDNGSVTFSFAVSTDRNGKHESLNVLSAPTYYPLLQRDIEQAFADNGFAPPRYFDLDTLWFEQYRIKEKHGSFADDFANIQWYGVLTNLY